MRCSPFARWTLMAAAVALLACCAVWRAAPVGAQEEGVMQGRPISPAELWQPQINPPRGTVPTVDPAWPWEAFRWSGSYVSSFAPCKIILDGDFSDWDSIPALPDPAWDPDARHPQDPVSYADIPDPDVDIRQWKFTNDDKYLYVYVEVAPEGIMMIGAPDAKDAYFLMVHLDVDNNMNTGFHTFDPSLPPQYAQYTDWYCPANIGSDYAFEVGYGNPPAHPLSRFRTFITYWGPGNDELGPQTYEGMKEIREDMGAAVFLGNRLEMGFPLEAFGGNVKDGTIMDVALSVEAAGAVRGFHWCQDSTEAIDDYVVMTSRGGL